MSDRLKEYGVMADDQLCPYRNRVVYRRIGHVQAGDRRGHFGRAVTRKQADVVPFLCRMQRCALRQLL